MSDREAFRSGRDVSKVIHQAAKLARSKAVAENQVLRAVIRSMRVTDVTWAPTRSDGALVQVEGETWLDKPTGEVFERILNELREGIG